MTFVDECVVALGGYSRILSTQEEKDVIARVESKYHFNLWGRIIWDNIVNKQVTSVDKMYDDLSKLDLIKDFGSSVYIIWNSGILPSVYSEIEQVVAAIEYVIMGYDTFIYAESGGYIIEIYHEGEITIGWS